MFVAWILPMLLVAAFLESYVTTAIMNLLTHFRSLCKTARQTKTPTPRVQVSTIENMRPQGAKF